MRPTSRRGRLVLWTAAVVSVACGGDTPVPRPTSPAPLVAAVVYRSDASSAVPPLDALAAVRAYDFQALVWEGDESARATVRERAGEIGLDVLDVPVGERLTPAGAVSPPPAVTLDVSRPDASVEALAWRALAYGARTIVFDSGAPIGPGFSEPDGQMRAWVPKARAVARQLRFNEALLAVLRPAPAVRWVEPAPAGLDVAVRQTERSWLLIATNTSAVPVRGVVKVPPALPPALWVDLLDGTEMSMLNQPDGPRWTFDLGPDGVRVYAIDK